MTTALLDLIAQNRFLPAPPAELMFCGDGDYRAIGAEFLGHFIELGGLAPHERVLDIGCGIGRMAVPLTQYLRPPGCYDGIDVNADGIAWCGASISTVYPDFRFTRLDLHHPLYNPEGTQETAATPVPFADGSVDFICMISVLTHLEADALTHYAAEVARLLAPGGRCFATAFLMNAPARDALASGHGNIGFSAEGDDKIRFADSAAPLAAVCFDEDFLVEKFLRAGMHRRRPTRYGSWSGRPGASFQDLMIFEGA
jgi:SAM-dependent methyltransferase